VGVLVAVRKSVSATATGIMVGSDDGIPEGLSLADLESEGTEEGSEEVANEVEDGKIDAGIVDGINDGGLEAST
jgi:hypothetical protein